MKKGSDVERVGCGKYGHEENRNVERLEMERLRMRESRDVESVGMEGVKVAFEKVNELIDGVVLMCSVI